MPKSRSLWQPWRGQMPKLKLRPGRPSSFWDITRHLRHVGSGFKSSCSLSRKTCERDSLFCCDFRC